MGKVFQTVMLALVATPGWACEMLEPFRMDQIAGADLVVVGEVTEFKMIEAVWGAALVTVRVDEVLKGRAGGEVEFIWTAGMAQGPYPERAVGSVLIGAMEGGRIVVSSRVPDLRPDLPSIIQPYCGEVWMKPARTDVVAEAKEALE